MQPRPRDGGWLDTVKALRSISIRTLGVQFCDDDRLTCPQASSFPLREWESCLRLLPIERQEWIGTMTAASPATASRLLSPSPGPALLGATDARRVCDEFVLLAPMKMHTCLEIAE